MSTNHIRHGRRGLAGALLLCGVSVALVALVGVASAARQAAPQNTDPPTVAGTAQEGQKLVGHRGQWSGNPTDYNDFWQRCDKDGGSCANISGATDKNGYILKNVDVGNTIRFKVVAQERGRQHAGVIGPNGGRHGGQQAGPARQQRLREDRRHDPRRRRHASGAAHDRPDTDRAELDPLQHTLTHGPLPRQRLRRPGRRRPRLRHRRPLRTVRGRQRTADRRRRLGNTAIPSPRRLPRQPKTTTARHVRPRPQSRRKPPRRHLHPPPRLLPRHTRLTPTTRVAQGNTACATRKTSGECPRVSCLPPLVTVCHEHGVIGATDSAAARHPLAANGAITPVSNDGVTPDSAHDRVAVAVARQDGVITRATVEAIAVDSTNQQVVACAAIEAVAAVPSVQPVVSAQAQEQVVIGAAGQRVRRRCSRHRPRENRRRDDEECRQGRQCKHESNAMRRTLPRLVCGEYSALGVTETCASIGFA